MTKRFDDLTVLHQAQDTTAVSDAAAASGKIRPATPLPWHQGPIIGGDDANDECVFCTNGEIVADCGARATLDDVSVDECIQNAAYVNHACNNYERLVAALIQAAQQLDYLHDKYPPTSSGEAVLSRTNSLLAELGELK